METKYIDLDTLRFQLFEVLQVEELSSYQRFAEYDRRTIEFLLTSIKAFSDQELYPYFKVMDDNPVRFVGGQVKVHPQVENIIRKGRDLGLFCPSFDYADGGMQLSNIIYTALWHIMDAANNHVTGYIGLTNGAAKLIRSFGSQKLFDKYVPHMMAGRWLGTMALTEPDAGSSLSDITTTAYPQSNGTYKMKGQKIFISGGDHQYADNFVHLTLARIKGAPAGTRGISLFVVPKLRLGDDDQLTSNDLITAGEIEKLGQRGYVTTHLVYGENDDCVAELVGEANEGLKYMFQMMNEARISVGISAASMATAASHASYAYANERRQGRPILSSGKKDVHAEPIVIAQHPDVKRMLQLQKAISQGAVSLVLEASRLADLAKVERGGSAEEAHLLLELLTPVAKTYPAEMGQIGISNGLQVLGGYGYTMDFTLQQYYRDVRIAAIYEGTTGIQSLDLLGRKILMKEGHAVHLLEKKINADIECAKAFSSCLEAAEVLDARWRLAKSCIQNLLPFAKSGDYQAYLADATIFMELFGHLLVGWQWLKMGLTAAQQLTAQSGALSDEFYRAQLETMQFYYKYEMPKILAGVETLKSRTKELVTNRHEE